MQIEATSRVQFGRTEIAYAIRRSARRRTVSVMVDPDDGVVLTAPEAVPVDRLDQVVRDKAPWILERLRRGEELDLAPAPRQFVSGETFLYLGRQYRLRVRAAARPGPARLDAGWLQVETERGLDPEDRAAAVRAALVEWYRARAAQRLPEHVEALAEELGQGGVGEVIIADQRRRWASCDASGNLRFNWRIIQAPLRLIDYVVAHELVHLEHPNHTERFWRALEAAQSDYEARRAALRRLGPGLDW